MAGLGPFTARTDAGRAGVDAILADPTGAVVGLDFDGTLSPIVADPRRAYAHPGAAGVLRRLAAAIDAVVIVTGRPVAEAVELGGFGDVPGLVILGQYGLQRWEGGVTSEPEPEPGVAVARDRLPGLLRDSGAWVEDKGHALAVHTRRAPEPEETLARLEPALRELAAETGLRLEPGRLVLELRPPAVDKGAALRGFLEERHARSVLYTGDDLGDLPAFAAVTELRAEGTPGVIVCSGSTEVTELADRADIVVDGPDGVVSILGALADAVG